MTILQAIVLGIVEGLTEFLPISSTAHLVLASTLLNIPKSDFVKTFEIFIQLGAILAVLTLYWRQLTQIKYILVAFIPTAFVGLLFYNPIKHFLLGNVWVTLAAMFVGGVVLIFINRLRFISMPMTYKSAISIGLFQSLSVIPGVSRAAAAIVGGQIVGLVRKQAVEFSFLLALPTIAAATGLDLVKSHLDFTAMNYVLLATGFIVAYVTALLAIKTFISYMAKGSLVVFGWYRIVLASIIAIWLLR